MSAVIAGKDKVRRRAKLVSNIFDPWSVLVPVFGLAAYQSVGKAPSLLSGCCLPMSRQLCSPSLYAKIRASMWSQGGNRQKISGADGSRFSDWAGGWGRGIFYGMGLAA
jgi:hypothetical protein